MGEPLRRRWLVPEKANTVLRSMAAALKICGSVSSGTQIRTSHIPKGAAEIKSDVEKLLASTPAVVILADGGDAKSGDGEAGKASVYDFYASSAYFPESEPLLLKSFIAHKAATEPGTTAGDVTGYYNEVMVVLTSSRLSRASSASRRRATSSAA